MERQVKERGSGHRYNMNREKRTLHGTRLTVTSEADARRRREVSAVNKLRGKRAAGCASYQDSTHKTHEWKSQFHNERGGARMEDKIGWCGNGITSCATWRTKGTGK
jgi:hypothetical protein